MESTNSAGSCFIVPRKVRNNLAFSGQGFEEGNAKQWVQKTAALQMAAKVDRAKLTTDSNGNTAPARDRVWRLRPHREQGAGKEIKNVQLKFTGSVSA